MSCAELSTVSLAAAVSRQTQVHLQCAGKSTHHHGTLAKCRAVHAVVSVQMTARAMQILQRARCMLTCGKEGLR